MTSHAAAPQTGPAASENADIILIFDGGSLGNPGKGYGSFAYKGRVVRWPIMVEYPGITTNNQAEYRTLLEGLRSVLNDVEVTEQEPAQLVIEIRSDSRLIVEQVNRRWKVKNAELKPLRDGCLELLARFSRSIVHWHPRSESVRILGH